MRLKHCKLGSLSLIAIAVSFCLLSGCNVFAANGYTGYFDESAVYDDSLGSYVIEGGISTSDKATFISTIIDYHNGAGSNMQKVGADFIIQTMRGGKDHSRPDVGDVENWRSLVNDENIAISIGGFNYTITTYIPNQNTDDVTYRNKSWSTPSAMRFYDKRNPSKTLYAIDTHCGNPLGKLSGLNLKTEIITEPPSPINYNNTGCRPRKFTVTPSMSYDGSGNYSAVPVKVNFYYPGVNDFIGGPYSSVTNIDLPHKYSLAEDNMGIKVIEQRDSYSKVTTTVTDATTGEVISSTTVYVLDHTARTIDIPVDKCYNYELETSIWDDYDWIVDGDIKTRITPLVKSKIAVPDYPNTKSRDTTWQLNTLIYKPSKPIANMNNDKARGNVATTLNPCSNFKEYDSCQQVATGTKIFNPGDNLMAVLDGKIDDLEVGTKVCFAYSVYSRSSEVANMYHHSNLVCHVVSKKPKSRIINGDLLTGRAFNSPTNVSSNVDASTSKKASGVYGSWIEYGIAATGKINGAASGAAYINAASSVNTTNCAKLSFSNNGSTVCDYIDIATSPLGDYKTNRSLPSVVDSFTVTDALPIVPSEINSGNIGSLSKVYRAVGNIKIKDITIAKNQWVVINAKNSNVKIVGDIKYTDGVIDNVKVLPQLVIIAKSIDIADDVTGAERVKNVDSWLVATDYINTCSSVAEGTGNATNLSSKVCSDPLTVNGPIMTKTLKLRRTAGSGTGIATGDPAEVFNLRADAYLWARERAKKLTLVKSVYNIELPPRF